jgi:hypothetical protein
VPVNPPSKLSEDEKKLVVFEEDEVESSSSLDNIDPLSATTDDLHHYRTAARIRGIQGYSQIDNLGGEMAMGEGDTIKVIEGVSRFRTKQCRQQTPYIKAGVNYFVNGSISLTDVAANTTVVTKVAVVMDLPLLRYFLARVSCCWNSFCSAGVVSGRRRVFIEGRQ